MEQTFEAREIDIGYHPAVGSTMLAGRRGPEGYRIDRTASPMNRYTRWRITPDGKWANHEPVCFDSLPQEGWLKAEGFNWAAAERIESER